jgi:FkbM family methyltransferase
MARVSRNLQLNGLNNAKLFNLGLSDSLGSLRLNTSGVEGWAPSFLEKELKQWIVVPVTTVDVLCQQHPEYFPTVMKIDVEGFEGKVLSGMRKTLESDRLRAVFMELHPEFLIKNGQPIGRVLSLLEDNGYVIREFSQRNAEVHVLAARQLP